MQTKYHYALPAGMACAIAFTATVHAQPPTEDPAIERLRDAARTELAAEPKEVSKETEFTSGALGLQGLNPEISVTGDLLWSSTDSETTETKSDFAFRGLGIHAEAYLVPRPIR